MEKYCIRNALRSLEDAEKAIVSICGADLSRAGTAANMAFKSVSEAQRALNAVLEQGVS